MVGQTFNSINVTCHSRVLFLILSITWSVKGTLKTRPTDIVWSQQKYCSIDKLMFLELKLPVYIMILFKLIMMPWSLWLLKEKHNYHLPFACGWCKVRGVVFDFNQTQIHKFAQFLPIQIIGIMRLCYTSIEILAQTTSPLSLSFHNTAAWPIVWSQAFTMF